MSFDFFFYFIILFQHVIFIGMPTKEAKEDIEAHPLTAKSKITKCSI